MADRLTEKKEAAKKDEAYQPLWDTDQSIGRGVPAPLGHRPVHPGIHGATHGRADAEK